MVARNDFGEVVSDWIDLEVEAPETAFGNYAVLPISPIPEGGSATVEVSTAEEFSVAWEYSNDEGSYWRNVEYEQGMILSQANRRLEIDRSGDNLFYRTYLFRARVKKTYYPLGAIVPSTVSFLLEPVPVEALGAPALSSRVYSESRPFDCSFGFRSYYSPIIEWQAYDAALSVWRPLRPDQGTWTQGPDSASVQIDPELRGLEVRAVVRHEGATPQTVRSFQTPQGLHEGSSGILRGSFDLNGSLSAATAGGDRFVGRMWEDGSHSLATFELRQGVVSLSDQIIEPPPESPRFAQGLWLTDRALLVKDTAPEATDEYAQGKLYVYPRLEGLQPWGDPLTVRLPGTAEAGSRIVRADPLEDWAMVYVKNSDLHENSFLVGPPAEHSAPTVVPVPKPPEVSADDWFDNYNKAILLEGDLIVSGRTPLKEWRTARFDWDPGSGALDFVEITTNPGRNRFDFAYGDSLGLATARTVLLYRWERGSEFEEPLQYALDEKFDSINYTCGEFGIIGTPSDGPGFLVAPFTLEDGIGRTLRIQADLTDPEVSVLHRFRILSEDFVWIGKSLSDGRTEILAVPFDLVVSESIEMSPWVEAQLLPASREVAVRFRESATGGQRHRVLMSQNLDTWSEVSGGEVLTLDSDWDGDGETRLQELRVPDGERPRFFRIAPVLESAGSQ